jgi:hypothetical protein
MSVEQKRAVFARSEQTHQASISAIMTSMTLPKAMTMLEKSGYDKAKISVVEGALAIKGKGRFRKQPKGYSGVEGARKMLNEMIYESMSKYDAEIAKCTEYYSEQCAAMEMCRGQIAAANYVAANSRALILDAQATINRCEVTIPTTKYELKQHNLKCEHELHKMNERLTIVLGDIEVMTTILEMTDCEASSSAGFFQKGITMRKCIDKCKRTFIQFNHEGLQHKINKLQSRTRSLVSDSFVDLFQGVESLEAKELAQADVHQTPGSPTGVVINKTQFNNPPLPRTEVPADPCTDPDAGAPSQKDKESAKCTITHSPMCYKLQERFLLIQAGIQDERDELQEAIANMEQHCEEVRRTLLTQIANDEKMLDEAQAKLAMAMEKEANAGEVARQTATEHEQLSKDLDAQMKKCSDNYINFETEICGLKKIRGELYKLKGGGHTGFFQDCEVSKWDPEECSKVCGGGDQKLVRSILTHPNGGTKCLPLAAERSCNNQPCPVDCVLKAWSGWSKCSADCGGGVEQRLREVKQAMKYDGKPCGTTSETRACANQACEKDCDLSEWTQWSFCSKDCDGGTQKRTKYISHEPEGEGECPDEWSTKRLEYKQCNMFRCLTEESGDCSTFRLDTRLWTCGTLPPCCSGYEGFGADSNSVQCLPSSFKVESQYTHFCPHVVEPKVCNNTLDIVILLDGSGSLGKEGWKASVNAAQMLVNTFRVSEDSEGESKANVALILFSGPPTWSGVYKCTGQSAKSVDMETECRIKFVTHFTRKMKDLYDKIGELEWPQGSTLTSLALATAKAELSVGRKEAPSIVIVITDGRPLSYRKTTLAARSLRKAARLLWVPVTKYAPLKWVKLWATRRWQENVIVVDDFEKLATPDVITHIVADICPDDKHPGLR